MCIVLGSRTKDIQISGIDKASFRRIDRMLESSDVLVCYLYGSYARNQQTNLSDLDLAILMAQKSSALERSRLSLKLSHAIAESMNGVDVDLRVINDTPLEFRYNVIHEGIVIYSRDDEQRLKFESRTLMEYFDFKPMIHQYNQYMHRRIEETGKI